MGQCVSFLVNGTWSVDTEALARAKDAKLHELKESVTKAAERVAEEKKALMKMYDSDGIVLSDFQYSVGAKIIEYRAAVREYRLYSASYSEWLDLISTHHMTQITNSDHELKEIVEDQLRRSKEQTERRKNRGGNKDGVGVTSEAKQAAADAVSNIQHDQESDPLLLMPETSDTEMSFGAQVRKWKEEEKRQSFSLNAAAPEPVSSRKSKASANGHAKKPPKAVSVPLPLSLSSELGDS